MKHFYEVLEFWCDGERNRPLRMYAEDSDVPLRPPEACYVSASDAAGKGFTVWFRDSGPALEFLRTLDAPALLAAIRTLKRGLERRKRPRSKPKTL